MLLIISMLVNAALLALLFSPNFALWLHRDTVEQKAKIEDAKNITQPDEKQENKLSEFEQEILDSVYCAINGWDVVKHDFGRFSDAVHFGINDKEIIIRYNLCKNGGSLGDLHKTQISLFVERESIVRIVFDDKLSKEIVNAVKGRIEKDKMSLLAKFTRS